MHQGVSRLGVDIGGTFTDTAASDAGGVLRIGKTLTTPGQEGRGVLASIENSGVVLADATLLVHGTTLVINALLERRGASTALVTTAGFADVIELGRGSRPETYNPIYTRLPPFVPRELRFEVAERMSAAGQAVTVPTILDIDRVARSLRDAGVQAVAVAFLHAYRNPDHEQLVAQYLATSLPGMFITCSSDLASQWREYERFTTATANAYVAPLIRNYTSRLIEDLRQSGFAGDTLFLDASGGAVGRSTIERFPIRLVESGPVGGVIAAAKIARELELSNVVTLDIGGTTAKSALIEDGAFETLREYWIGGYARGLPLQVPVVDIEEVGAGGGSIAWLDSGRLRVGPRSAGAAPGPACYGLGGTEPAITDALVHCGIFHPSIFLAELSLNQAAATQAIAQLAERCGLTTDRLALGMLRLAHETTAGVVRRQTMERGLDPGGFTMIVSGGAGPGQACAVAGAVGIPRVLVPPYPGHFSAFGMLQSDLRFTRRALVEMPLATLTLTDLRRRIERLTAALEQAIANDSQVAGAAHSEQSLALRYAGQDHSLRQTLTPAMLESEETFRQLIVAEFLKRYERRYGYVDSQSPLDVIDIEVVVQRDLPQLLPTPASTGQNAGTVSVPCLFDEDRGFVEVPALRRDSLAVNAAHAGPLLIYELGSITAVPPEWTLQRIEGDHMLITRKNNQ